MLNQKSMPVWVLADALIAILSLSFVLGLTIFTVALPRCHSVDSDQSVNAMRSLRAELKAKSIALKTLQASQEEEKRLVQELKTSNAEMDAHNQQLRQSAASEGAYRKELLNLKGSFARTVFLIDTSGSMQEPVDVSKIDVSWGERPAPWPIVLSFPDKACFCRCWPNDRAEPLSGFSCVTFY